ncbi:MULTISPECIES: GGDEF domain-containing protein [Lactobacillaceae]|uniref:GGDEF domain-containing protein n=2 Tax=Lactobacillales TaxID=186826 RepID=UPI001456ABD4|nr:GGDEF domain-containing protein [Lactobacillus sp. HBUAS51381]NLR10219.1 GGDEF domain-containing protein [Lactobacillus sp. HBUAS51381]
MTWSQWFVAPALTSIFFLLGVLTLYWFMTNKIIQYLGSRGKHVNVPKVRTTIGLIYMLLLLIVTQAAVNGTSNSWVFTNFEIFAIAFVSYFLMLEIRLWQLLLATILFMLVNGTLFAWLPWAFVVVYIGFYFTLKAIKTHRHSPWRDFGDYASTTLLFSTLLWGITKVRFDLPLTTTGWEILFSFLLLTIMYFYVDSLFASASTLEKLTYTTNFDELTHVRNYFAFKNDFNCTFSSAQAEHQPLTLMLFDIDHFKHVNDTYGHLAGDYVLSTVAQLITEQLAAIDPDLRLYRTGGEEFTIIFNHYTTDQARTHVNAIAQAVKSGKFRHGGKPIAISISVGVTQLQTGDEDQLDVYRRADQNLYFSKRNGRDRVTIV